MKATSLDAVLDRFDTALAARPIQYHPLMEAFRSLKIPNGVTDVQLSRVLAVCGHVLDGDANPMDRDLILEQRNRLTSCALDQAMRILRDPDAHTRSVDCDDAGPVPRTRRGGPGGPQRRPAAAAL